VRIDYPSVRGTALGDSLLTPLQTGDEALDTALDAELERVVITWQGRRCPPTVRYLGINALQVVHHQLAAGAEVVASPWGDAALVRKPKEYALAIAAPREAVLATAKRMPALELGDLPPPSHHVVEIDANADDFKLGTAAKRIDRLHLRWSRTNRVRLTSFSSDAEQATWVKSYVNRRLPWLQLADGLGVDAAEFPARLLEDRKAKRTGSRTYVDMDLSDEDLRGETWGQLRKLIDRQTHRYRRN